MSDGSCWNRESIHREQRKQWAEATADWTADELRAKLAEIGAAIYPVAYVLSHLLDNPSVPHGGMSVTSDLFPYHAHEDEDAEDGPTNYGSKYDVDAKAWRVVPLNWGNPKPEAYEHQEVHFDAGTTLHESYTIMSIWQYATAASINCGSFNTADIARLCAATRHDKPHPPEESSNQPQHNGDGK